MDDGGTVRASPETSQDSPPMRTVRWTRAAAYFSEPHDPDNGQLI